MLEHRSKPLKKSAGDMFLCEACKHKDLSVPVFACLNIETGELNTDIPEKGWDAHDLFDVQLTLRKKRSTDDAPPRIVIDKWEFKEIDDRAFKAKYQGGEDDDDAKKIAERNKKPFDLAVVHAPDAPAVQSKILRLENLFGEKKGTMSRKSIRYSNHPDEDPENNSNE